MCVCGWMSVSSTRPSDANISVIKLGYHRLECCFAVGLTPGHVVWKMSDIFSHCDRGSVLAKLIFTAAIERINRILMECVGTFWVVLKLSQFHVEVYVWIVAALSRLVTPDASLCKIMKKNRLKEPDTHFPEIPLPTGVPQSSYSF